LVKGENNTIDGENNPEGVPGGEGREILGAKGDPGEGGYGTEASYNLTRFGVKSSSSSPIVGGELSIDTGE